MLSQAIDAMLGELSDFLPPPGAQPPTVSLVSAEERPLGLGQFRGIGLRHEFPVALKGLRVAATVRFQVWDAQPANTETAVGDLTEQLLAQKDALLDQGFLEIQLKNVTVSEHVPSLGAWRQTAEFAVLYEYHYQATDDAGGLIARLPVELREAFGAALVSGDLVVWNDAEAPPLVLNGRRPVAGLSALTFLPGAVPAGTVTVTRTFEGAAGAPAVLPDLDTFLAAVSGPAPAQTHARVEFATLSDFLTAIGPEGDAIDFVDEMGAPRGFRPRSRNFAQAVELNGPDDRFEVAFSGPALGANQILYHRGFRGVTNSS